MADSQYLPEHIIHQIFHRMPTKPVVRFKCLSKHWNSVISDPKFMKSRSRRMLFLPSLRAFHAMDSRDQSMFKLFSPDFFNSESCKEMITPVGSFNGIVLLVPNCCNKSVDGMHNCHVILYNPLSGEFKRVPNPPSFGLFNTYVYGFGYGTTEDDLKIVRLTYHYASDSLSSGVFSLKTWSWSKPSELTGDYCFCRRYSATFTNGFLYWIAIRKASFRLLIVVLDMKKMIFSVIEIPNDYTLLHLGTYNGRLCMICSQPHVEGYELRVMNEHAFGKSCLVCRFGSSSIFDMFNFYPYEKMCILDDGKLLVAVPGILIIYDMLNNSYNEVNGWTNSYQVRKLQCVEYVESLISPSDICNV